MNGLIDILNIVGALGLFIYGMKIMSEGIQRVAGASMRRILSAMTKSGGRAVFTGFLTTSIVQSSSATTVMIVSFVNAGLVTLRQAIGVIMGANIGTTVTAWLIAFAVGKISIADFALPIIGVSLPFIFFQRERLKDSADTLIGFAILFLGLQALQQVVPNLREHAEALQFLKDYADNGFTSILFFVFAGALITLIVQSSSAAIALTLTLLSNGMLPVEMAMAMVLGENIGTTITANIAAIVANNKAKAAARAHTVFNVMGVLWMLPILPFYYSGLELWFDRFFKASSELNPEQTGKILVAIFHTSFNLVNTILLIGATGLIERIAKKLVFSKSKDEAFKLAYIEGGVFGTSELVILEVQKELKRFSKVPHLMNQQIELLLDATEPADRDVIARKLKENEKISDKFENEITKYLTDLSKEEMSPATSKKVQILIAAAGDLERIADLYLKIATILRQKNDRRTYFVPKQRQNLKDVIRLLNEAFESMQSNLEGKDEDDVLRDVNLDDKRVKLLFKDLKEGHLKDLSKGRYSAESGIYYADVLSALEEVTEQLFSISKRISR